MSGFDVGLRLGCGDNGAIFCTDFSIIGLTALVVMLSFDLSAMLDFIVLVLCLDVNAGFGFNAGIGVIAAVDFVALMLDLGDIDVLDLGDIDVLDLGDIEVPDFNSLSTEDFNALLILVLLLGFVILLIVDVDVLKLEEGDGVPNLR